MNNIQTEILKDFKSSKESIKVAVSWLTDSLLINELIAARKRGIEVKVILSSNELNIIRFELFQELINQGAIVNKYGNPETDQGNFMHYKFYIIDNKIAKSGSYNMSMNATTNKEAFDEVPVLKKLSEFNDCFKESVNFFQDIDNPELKRAELALIEKEYKDALTPEKLDAYRKVQKALKDQDIKHKKELEERERQNKVAKENEAKAILISEKLLAEKIEKEKQIQYSIKKDAPAVSEAPPRSYAI